MSSHNAIILSSEPRGNIIEGVIVGTPKPGTLMQLQAGVEPDGGGRHSWVPYAPGTDGNRRPIAVLLPDNLQGGLITDAYVTGTRGKLYFPIPGDELNMLVANISGTSDAFAIGDLLIADTGTGKLIATTGSPESEPFQVMETVAALTADAHVHCMYTGH